MIAVLFVGAPISATSWSEDEAKGVQTEQRSTTQIPTGEKDKTEGGKNGQFAPPAPATIGENDDWKGQSAKEEAKEEGTEFWPPWYGYRLKITDTIIAAFTALLFVATAYLYLATRKLVIGAEDTAKHQLRAYVFVESSCFHNVKEADAHKVWANVIIKNFGQTPAKDVRLWTKISNSPITKECVQSPPKGIGSVIGPGGTLAINSDKMLVVSENVDEYIIGVRKIYFAARIDYDDCFGKSSFYIFQIFSGEYHSTAVGGFWEAKNFQNYTEAD